VKSSPLYLALFLGLFLAATVSAEETVTVMPTGGLRGETAAFLLSGQEGGALPLAVLALALPSGGSGGGRTRVPVIVEVDGRPLLAGHQEGPLDVEVCLYALGPRGEVQATLLETVEIAPEGLPDLGKGGLQFSGELLLPAGETSLRILLRDPATGDFGLRLVTLTVPAFQEGMASLSAPLFAAPAGAWVVARAEGVLPLLGRGEAAARPVLAPGAEATFQALAYRLWPEARWSAELRRHAGDPRLIELPVRLAGRSVAEAPDLEILSAAVTLPQIEPGEYELRLRATRGDGAFVSPSLPVVVSPTGGQTWAALGLPSAPASARSTPPAPDPAAGAPPKGARPRHRRIETAPLKAAYLTALRLLGSGDEAGGRAAVAAFETLHLVTDREPMTSADLVEVEAPVAGEIARRDPEALVALLALYARLYHMAVDRGDLRLSAHDGEVVFGLAELYAKQSRSPATRELAAGFLADLARERPDSGLSILTRRALERALTYDGKNEAALLTLAADAGWRGDVRAAADLLERLLRVHPESLEARLRLALSRARLGDSGRARQLLGEVLSGFPGEPGDLWLFSLAYQELARLQVSAGQLQEAAGTVAAGLIHLPGDEALLLEQAFLLDCGGEHGRAREILERVETPAESGGTPRHRYNQPPRAALGRAARLLETRAAEHLPALAAAAAAVHLPGAQP
jgi:hypothetical protein